MENFLTPLCLGAVCTALAGVALFALAPYLPAPFPSYITRLVGFAVVLTTILPLWVATGSWTVTTCVDGACLAVIVAVHVLQTRKESVSMSGDGAHQPGGSPDVASGSAQLEQDTPPGFNR